MQVKTSFLTILQIFIGLNLFAQQDKPRIALAEKEFNFGTVREIDGIITHDFQFTNQGKVPLILKEVKSTCGCTVSEWPHEPILPGQAGMVRVSFNPEKQKGAVYKTIQIISNAAVAQEVLTLSGVVIPAEKVEDIYKFTMGDIRLQTIYAAFGEIPKGSSKKYSIKVFNNSTSQNATLTFRNIPPHLNIISKPEMLEPQQEGIIELEFNTTAINAWDYVVNRLDMLINGKEVANNRMNVTATIKEDFSGLTGEQLAMAAHVQFDSTQYDFGNIAGDQVVEHSFKLTNTGKSTLYIRNVTASCGCTAVQPLKNTVPPGESTEIKAIFNARGREGKQKKAITVITNDPKRSRTILWINAMIVSSAKTKASQ